MDQKLSYSEIEQQCRTLDGIVTEFNDCRQRMTNTVNILCDGWTSETSNQTRENYAVLARSVDQTVNVVEELKAKIREYSQNIQALDAHYAATTVN